MPSINNTAYTSTHNTAKHSLTSNFPFKAHKLPAKDQRFITSCRVCSMRDACILLNLGFGALKHIGTLLWNSLFEVNNFPPLPIWIINNSQNVKHMVEQLNQNKPPGQRAPLCTLDFSTLYTSLPQSQLINRLSNYIRATCSHKFNIDRSTHLYFNKHTHSYKPPVWCSRPSPSQDAYDVLLDADKFIEFLNFQIENSFIAFGELFLQQTIGIPMGVNDRVHLADTFLFTYAFDFFLQLINLYCIPLTHAFALTERFLDDLLSLNNPDFKKHRYHTRSIRFSFFNNPPSPVNLLASLVPQQRYNLRSLQHAEIQGITVTPSSKLKLNTTPHHSLSLTYKSKLSAKYKAIQFNRYPDIRSALAPHISANILNTTACNLLKLSRKKHFMEQVIHVMLALYFKHQHSPNFLNLLSRNFYHFCIQHQNHHFFPQHNPLSIYHEVINSVRHHVG
eukprot:g16053.t1